MVGLSDTTHTVRHMLLVVVTGGIGSGKSTVSSGLVERGAVLVDADAIVKELQEPGQPVFEAMVARWGAEIVADDGRLNRQAVADIVFNDGDELNALNGMVHPAVHTEMNRRIDEQRPTDNFVVLDIPLLLGREDAANRGASAVIVVDCPTDVAVERLIEHRGFSREDAEARIAAQSSRDERVSWADFVVDNSGDLAHLESEIERCWQWLPSVAPGPLTP